MFELGRAADAVRRRLHPDGVVTYIVDRNINYTNVCSCGCSFCAFYRKKDAPDAYVLSEEELSAKIVDTIAAGGVRVLLQGGLHPDWGIDEAVRLVRAVKRHPILLHGFSPPEVWHFAHQSKMTIGEVIARLTDAGLDSIPGGGAEILDDEVRRRISPKKIGWEQWAAVMREAHRQGLRSSATMMFGSVESPEAIVAHLLRVRALQEETGGFTAFIPWVFQPGNTELSRDPRFGEASARGFGHAVGYLRVLALSRILLPNVSDRPGVVGDDGGEGGADRALLRRGRLRQHDDGGERGRLRGRLLPDVRGGDRRHDPGRRVHRRTAVRAVQGTHFPRG